MVWFQSDDGRHLVIHNASWVFLRRGLLGYILQRPAPGRVYGTA
jgi:hypothetical protein